MAAREDSSRQEVIADAGSYDFALQDFGDEPVGGARAVKKPVQGSVAAGCKRLDALDEIRMLN
jgi:hypothetical protein